MQVEAVDNHTYSLASLPLHLLQHIAKFLATNYICPKQASMCTRFCQSNTKEGIAVLSVRQWTEHRKMHVY